MSFIKKVSALLAAVMAFSIVGMSVGAKNVAAATTSIDVKTGTYTQRISHGLYEYYEIGRTSCIEFVVNGLTAGQNYTLSGSYVSDMGYLVIAPNLNYLASSNYQVKGVSGGSKVTLDSDNILSSYYDGNGYLIEGYYKFTVNGVEEIVHVTGDTLNGSYSRSLYGSISCTPGLPNVVMVHHGQIGVVQTGVTNQLITNLTDDMPSLSSTRCWKVEYFDSISHIVDGPNVVPTPVTTVVNNSNSFSVTASAGFANSFGNFITGFYRIGVYDNASAAGNPIAQVMFYVTGNGERDGYYPDNNPERPDFGLGGFVERCYTCCLGRASEPAGKAYWIHCLEGAYTGCDVAKEFFFCDEFNSLRLSNEEYVTRLYKTFMDRTPEQAGFDFWVNCLRNGSSRLDVFYGFVNSPEWRDICAVYGIRSGGVVMPTNVSISASQQAIAFVGRLYATGLGRDPEAAGLKMWAEALDRGTATGTSVASNFFLGAEFTNQNVSNQEFLIRAYRIFMDRPIDIDNDPGFLYWLGQLNSGRLSRADIVNTFAASDEFRNICAGAGFNA